MKKIAAIMTLVPTVAFAHDGHNGLGVFHHAGEGIAVIALVACAYYLSKKLGNK